MGGGQAAPVARKTDTANKTAEELAEEFVRYLAHHNLLRYL
jgi:hypothetical protein